MKDKIKILLLLLVLAGIIFATIKINNSDIKPIVTLNKSAKESTKKKEDKKEEPKKEEPKKEEEEKKEETPIDNPTEEQKPVVDDGGSVNDLPAPEPAPAQQSIIPDINGGPKTILCSHAEVAESGTNYMVQLLAYYDRVGGTMAKMIIYAAVESLTMTPEERQQLAILLERELKNDFPSFTSQTSVTDTQAQAVLTGTPQDLLKDYKILDEESLDYYNFAPTLRYEGFTCTMN